MDCLAPFVESPIGANFPRLSCGNPRSSVTLARPSLSFASKRRFWGLRSKISNEDDLLLEAAMDTASLRFHETHRPEPLVHDPYAGCFVPPNTKMDMKEYTHPHLLATKFIDDKLLRILSHIDGVKQVVLLTDGMDTRPYRLNWPNSTVLFDISPERVFKQAAETLEGVGAKIASRCLFFHIPLESSNMQGLLCQRGFNGNRPSIWAIQGLPLMTLANFEEVLSLVSSLAMNGSLIFGESPAWLADTGIGVKPTTGDWMEKLYMSHGFRVDVISYDEVAKGIGRILAPVEYKKILFVAEQLRLSDDQMDTWRREFCRLEEEGDEEGFEEL